MIEMEKGNSLVSSPKKCSDIVVMWCSADSSESLPFMPWPISDQRNWQRLPTL